MAEKTFAQNIIDIIALTPRPLPNGEEEAGLAFVIEFLNSPSESFRGKRQFKIICFIRDVEIMDHILTVSFFVSQI